VRSDAITGTSGERLERFELIGGGHAVFTSRVHGNLSSVGGEAAEHGGRAREALRAELGLESLERGYQVHGTRVRLVSERPSRDGAAGRPPDADGQATSLAGVGVMVLAADCLPVGLGCEGSVAMVHAGWRGLAAGVLEEGVAALRALAGPDAQIDAVIGPGAGACCYEVGAEVRVAFAHDSAAGVAFAHDSAAGVAFAQDPGERARIDLRAIARERLLGAGVARVRDLDACTICDARYFSHRREGERAGRQAGVAWLDGVRGSSG
jgi:YfiH family protein